MIPAASAGTAAAAGSGGGGGRAFPQRGEAAAVVGSDAASTPLSTVNRQYLHMMMVGEDRDAHGDVAFPFPASPEATAKVPFQTGDTPALAVEDQQAAPAAACACACACAACPVAAPALPRCCPHTAMGGPVAQLWVRVVERLGAQYMACVCERRRSRRQQRQRQAARRRRRRRRRARKLDQLARRSRKRKRRRRRHALEETHARRGGASS